MMDMVELMIWRRYIQFRLKYYWNIPTDDTVLGWQRFQYLFFRELDLPYIRIKATYVILYHRELSPTVDAK